MILRLFYDNLRGGLFQGKISAQQFEGIEALLNEWNRQKGYDWRRFSYILGTVYHETRGTMQPVEETGRGVGKPYGKKLKYGGGPGKRIPYTNPDKLYYGRGHTQNTWYEVYEALSKAARAQGKNWDFLANPELLLEMEPSVWATFYAMKVGLYTGKQLDQFFNNDREDWLNARKIVNGKDRAVMVASYAMHFYDAVIGAGEKRKAQPL